MPYFGKIMGYGNILPIAEENLEIQSKVKIKRAGFQKVIHIIKLLIYYKIVRKELIKPPSECIFGVRRPMRVYELASELMDENNTETEI